MSVEVLQDTTTATLICVAPLPEDRGNLKVMGLELPGSTPMMHAGVAARNSEEHELRWPAHMVDGLAEFYDETFVRRVVEDWNCHTFGAQVTARTDRAQLDYSVRVTNAVKGPEISSDEIQNGELYGIYSRFLGRLIHTLVGTQVNGMCLNVRGFRQNLYYSPVGDVRRGYKGRLHPYTYAHRRPGRTFL